MMLHQHLQYLSRPIWTQVEAVTVHSAQWALLSNVRVKKKCENAYIYTMCETSVLLSLEHNKDQTEYLAVVYLMQRFRLFHECLRKVFNDKDAKMYQIFILQGAELLNMCWYRDLSVQFIRNI